MSLACDIKTPLGQCAAFIGDIARPFAIIATSFGASVATMRIALVGEHFSEGAIFIGAVFTGVSALYAAKAMENWGQAREAAKVEVAKAPVQP